MQNNHTLSYNNNHTSAWWRRAKWLVSRVNRGFVVGAIMFAALLAFELFNYTTTDFALSDFLGSVRFLGLRWAMILAIAFCGMDFAGIARLFTPERERVERAEVWYLLGAWFLAATMNAMLTWWGVSLALLQHQALGNEILSRQQLIKIVPVFVAVLVWLIRVLLIGTFSMAGNRLFSQADSSGHPAAVSRPRPLARPVSDVSPRPVRLLGEEADFDQRPQPAPSVPSEVHRPVVERPAMRPVPPVMPTVRPAPKPAATSAPLAGSNGGRPVVAQTAAPHSRADVD
jgi:hypothetical protein